MDSFEINKIVAAILMVALLIIGLGKISDLVFHVEKPKTSGYTVELEQVAAIGVPPIEPPSNMKKPSTSTSSSSSKFTAGTL